MPTVKFAAQSQGVGFQDRNYKIPDFEAAYLHPGSPAHTVVATLAANTTQIVNVPNGLYRVNTPDLTAAQEFRAKVALWTTAKTVVGIVSGTGGFMRLNIVAHGAIVGDAIDLQGLTWTGGGAPANYGNGRTKVTVVVDADRIEVPIFFPAGAAYGGAGVAGHATYAPVDATFADAEAMFVGSGPGPHQIAVDTGSGGILNNSATYPVGFAQLCIRVAAISDLYVSAKY